MLWSGMARACLPMCATKCHVLCARDPAAQPDVTSHGIVRGAIAVWEAQGECNPRVQSPRRYLPTPGPLWRRPLRRRPLWRHNPWDDSRDCSCPQPVRVLQLLA